MSGWMRGALSHSDSSLSGLDEHTPPPSLDRPPLLWPGVRGVLGTVFAVVSVLLLQVVLSAYYWLADPHPSVALAPVWDLPVIALLLVLLAAIGVPRWIARVAVIGLSIAVFGFFLLGVGQGFALREFGYDVVLRLHVGYVPELFRMMYDAEPPSWFVFYCALLAVGTLVLVLAIYGAVRHLYAFARVGRRRQIGLTLGVAAGFGLGALVLGPSGPIASEARNQIDLALHLKERIDATARRLDMEAASHRRRNPFVGGPQRPSILVFVVESYGHVLFTDRGLAEFPPWLDRKGSELGQAGYQIASRTMTAPVFGGSSWLAASSLLCGVRIHNQKRFEALYGSTVRCLPALLDEAGYRTVIGAPNTKLLEDRYGRTVPFDRYYFLPDFDYRGPRMGWSFMPDQYAIDFVGRREIAQRSQGGAGREPVFAALFLTSSHHPWSTIPPFIDDWSRIGDGSIYHQVAPTELDNGLLAGAAYRPAYRASIQYSLQSVMSYVASLPRDDRTLIFVLGDHQPRRPIASMKEDSWLVPIHVLSRDPAAVARFARAGYTPGVVPAAPGAAPSGLERFIDELFAAYSDGAGAR